MKAARGFILLPVILLMTLLAVLAYAVNRERGNTTVLLGRDGDIERARYAAEAGLVAVKARVQSIVSTSWSGCSAGGFPTVGNPIVNSSFGNASYTAYASSANASVLDLVSTGHYRGASVTLTRNNVIIHEPVPSSTTLQPAAAAGVDTYIRSGSSNNYGTATRMHLKNGSRVPLITFSLTGVPAGSYVSSAVMELRSDDYKAGVNVSAFRLTVPWNESSVNWTTSDGTTPWPTAGGSYHPDELAQSSLQWSPFASYLQFTLTEMVHVWLSGRYPNYGLILHSDDSENLQLYSSDNSSYRPALELWYYAPCP